MTNVLRTNEELPVFLPTWIDFFAQGTLGASRSLRGELGWRQQSCQVLGEPEKTASWRDRSGQPLTACCTGVSQRPNQRSGSSARAISLEDGTLAKGQGPRTDAGVISLLREPKRQKAAAGVWAWGCLEGEAGLGRKAPMPRSARREPLHGSLAPPPGRTASGDGPTQRPRVDGLGQECRLVAGLGAEPLRATASGESGAQAALRIRCAARQGKPT